MIVKTDYQDVHRSADRLTPGLRNQIARELTRLTAAVSLEQIEAALDRGPSAVLALLPEGLPPNLVETLTSTALRAATVTATIEAAQHGLTFQAVNERAVRWAEEHTGRLIQRMTVETRRAVQDVIVRGQVDGIPPARQARMIRGSLGLSRRQAGTLARMVAAVEDDVQAGRVAERVRRRMIRERAESIARTETMQAANMGQQLTWETAQDENLLPAGVAKVWVVTPDDRLCPICAPLDGEQVAITESFRTDRQATGFTARRTGDDRVDVTGTKPLPAPIVVQVPPAHPRCRCAVALAT